MSETEKNGMPLKKMLITVIVYSILLFIWEEFVIYPTAFRATEQEDGVPSGAIYMDDKNEVLIREEEENNRFRAIAVSKGFFGGTSSVGRVPAWHARRSSVKSDMLHTFC